MGAILNGMYKTLDSLAFIIWVSVPKPTNLPLYPGHVTFRSDDDDDDDVNVVAECRVTSEFTCQNGRCVLRTRCNDGVDDCWDNSDETVCGTYRFHRIQYWIFFGAASAAYGR